jgi:hypothetical protein
MSRLAIDESLQSIAEMALGTDERLFEAIPPDQITDLHQLHEELDFVDGCSQSMCRAN